MVSVMEKLRSKSLRGLVRERVAGSLLDMSRRVAGRHLCPPGTDGLTIVTVSFNSLDYLQAQVGAVRRFTKRPFEYLVVDNNSTDGTKDWLRSQADIRSVLLPTNIMHGPALDLAVCMARTNFVVTLDVDAFPITPGWEEVFIGPLNDGYSVVGGDHPGPLYTFAHPSALAVGRPDFLQLRQSFRPVRRGGRTLLDTGVAVSFSKRGAVKLIDVTERRGPGFVGTVYGNAVYHNWASVRSRAAPMAMGQTGVDSAEAWDEAVERFL